MATLERYSSFEEMKKASAVKPAIKKDAKVKNENTIKAFALLLRQNVVIHSVATNNPNKK